MSGRCPGWVDAGSGTPIVLKAAPSLSGSRGSRSKTGSLFRGVPLLGYRKRHLGLDRTSERVTRSLFQGVMVQGLEVLAWRGVWLRWNVANASPAPGGVLVALVVRYPCLYSPDFGVMFKIIPCYITCF